MKIIVIIIIIVGLTGCNNQEKTTNSVMEKEKNTEIIKESNEITDNNISSSTEVERKTIVIDPGHQTIGDSSQEPIGPGATETKAKVTTGATGIVTGQKESILNLKVALLLKKELEKRNYNVVLTRDTEDINISNKQRAEIANNANATAFIRIHANSYDNESVRGVLTMCQTEENIYNGNLSVDSCNLSQKIVDNISKQTGFINKGVTKTDTMSGINWSKVPVSIVEMGFLSNKEEDQLLATDEYQEKIALGIADGIDEFIN